MREEEYLVKIRVAVEGGDNVTEDEVHQAIWASGSSLIKVTLNTPETHRQVRVEVTEAAISGIVGRSGVG